MKRVLFIIAIVVGLAPLIVSKTNPPPSGAGEPQTAATPLKMPTTLTLGTDAKLGAVAFNHEAHAATGKRNIAGTGPITCVECHHAAQPAAEVAKHPPLKTAYPPDRTTTLTAELVEKDPAAIGVVGCRSCHARAGMKPATLPEIPSIKHESSPAVITLTNLQAFHRSCASCHDEVMKQRPDAKAPRTQQCTACHKKA